MAFRDAFGQFARGFGGASLVEEFVALKEATNQSPEVKRALEAAGERIVATIELAMLEAGPPPSSPGGAPAIDSETLVRSYRYVVENGPKGLTLAVGSDVYYAPFLEFGTATIDPRPALAPAMDSNIDNVRRAIGEGIVRAQRAAIGRMPRIILE